MMNIINKIVVNDEVKDIMGEKRTIKESITHQNIGGKEIVIEGKVSFQEIVVSAVFNGNMACKNYLDRRDNAVDVERHYYGKVGNLGYIVGCDEFVEGDFL